MERLIIDKNFCMSSYLAFRYIAAPGVGFSENLVPEYPKKATPDIKGVATANDIECVIQDILAEKLDEHTGILLSGGMDSAIIASYLPAGTKAYSISFEAPNAVDETVMAQKYAEYCDLDFHVVEVTWADYLASAPSLMRSRKAPLHQIEGAVYKAAVTAKADHIDSYPNLPILQKPAERRVFCISEQK